MSYRAQYSEYNDFNRFENLDGVEYKIIQHLINSETKHADLLWKILKYADNHALSQPSVTKEEREELVCKYDGDFTNKRLFFVPYVDDAWQEQCSQVYVYVDDIHPTNHLTANVGVTVEVLCHNKILGVYGDGDEITNPQANPNDSDENGDIVVAIKNRATVMLKCILAELNGIYLDGIGYLQFNDKDNLTNSREVSSQFNTKKSFFGFKIQFTMVMAGDSSSPSIGY